MNATVTKRITTHHQIKIGREAMLDALRKAGYEIPDNASLEFRVPTGGDYSGLDVDLEESPLRVSFTEIVTIKE